MRHALRTACLTALVLLPISSAWAHYLWVTVTPKGGMHGTVNIYFEGGPGHPGTGSGLFVCPGDGKYLDPFIKRGTTWIRTLDAPKSAVLKVEETKSPGKRWLSAKIPASAPRVIDSFAMWGVYTYGKTEVLLHYYAKNAEVSSAAQLNRIGRSDKLPFDVAPTLNGQKLTCQVTWNSKPAPACKVSVRGPSGFKTNMKTDAKGNLSFTVEKKGRYTVHATLDEADTSGTQDGKKYDLKRHHSTLIMTLPLAATTE